MGAMLQEVVPSTCAFADPSSRADHFRRHGIEVGALSEMDYERWHPEFMSAEPTPHVVDGVRHSNGDNIRYGKQSGLFAVTRKGGIIKTFFKPDTFLARSPKQP